jgi:hypothetical protein
MTPVMLAGGLRLTLSLERIELTDDLDRCDGAAMVPAAIEWSKSITQDRFRLSRSFEGRGGGGQAARACGRTARVPERTAMASVACLPAKDRGDEERAEPTLLRVGRRISVRLCASCVFWPWNAGRVDEAELEKVGHLLIRPFAVRGQRFLVAAPLALQSRKHEVRGIVCRLLELSLFGPRCDQNVAGSEYAGGGASGLFVGDISCGVVKVVAVRGGDGELQRWNCFAGLVRRWVLF